MRSIIIGFLLSMLMMFSQRTEAQTVELLAGNTLNGAMNGVILGGAAMGINNQTDFDALRIGLGLGTLYGIGMGGYDLTSSGGGQLVVSGLFNDGSNSSIIVLLDTFYGAAVGSVIVTSILLVANEPIIDGLQYGASIGAFAGFGFGLFDTFVLADRVSSPLAFKNTPGDGEMKASGLIGISLNNKTSVGVINPTFIQQLTPVAGGMVLETTPAVELASLRINF